MIEKVLQAGPYFPTSPRTGSAPEGTMLRLKNLILTGVDNQDYLQCYKGSLNLSETIATSDLTGTISAALGVTTIIGVGTSFKSELRPGQRFFAGSDFFMVNEVTDDTHLTVYRGPVIAALVAATGKRLPVIFEIGRKRGTLIQGNALELDSGTIIGTGQGTLRVNGVALNATMVLVGSPRIAVFSRTLGLYTVYDLGFTTPTTNPVITDAASGTRKMQPGNFSQRLVPGRSVTQGYGNPGPPRPFTITTADHRAKNDVTAGPAMDTTHGQDQWDVYVTESDGDPNQGPWWFWGTVTTADIVTNFFYVEYLDAEVNRNGLLDFNNDPPPASGFVATLEGNPIWISCKGKLTDNFGPSIRPAKPRNIEGAPAEWDVTSSPPQYLLGVVTSLARLYLPTPASLQQGIWLGSSDPFQIIPPATLRPYWSVGFSNENQLIFVLGELYGNPHSGPTKSVADAERVTEQFFGQRVVEILKNLVNAHGLVGYDPQLQVVCFFYPASSRNDAGFWETRVLIWGIEQGNWIGDVVITDATRDMCVCGVATVNEKLEFLAGGRFGGGVQVDSFRWNTVSGASIPWYGCCQLTDFGVNDQNKAIKAMRVNAKVTNGNMQLYTFDDEVNVDIDAIEAGTGSASGNIPLGTTTGVQQFSRGRMNFPNAAMAAIRVSGTWAGSGEPDRVDEFYMAALPTGNRR